MTAGFDMKPDAVYFVPLGGCGMFGANMSLYGYRGKWIMVDCGMGFADDTMPGIDILLPDIRFAKQLGDDLLAIVLTHAHEDHIGAIEYLWPQLKKPLYATKFTAARIRQAVGEQVWGGHVQLHEIPPRGKIDLEPFDIQYVRMAHSIPEAHSLAISVGGIGTLLHTGDWKIDPDPIEGHMTDEQALTDLGKKGVLALVGDSTNAMVPGHSGSEGVVQKNLIEVFSEFKNRIVISCFSTNVARLHSIDIAARKNRRKVCLVGRSLWNIDEAARTTGYLKGVPPFLSTEDAERMAPEELLYVCTGSQGEPRAALSRISNDDHPDVQLAEDDVVIFSSRAIPGNEKAIDRIKNRFYAKGVNVITDRDAPIHVSGHPYRDELKKLYSWVRPKFSIPVHGEHMQLEKHAGLADECGVQKSIIPSNGKIIEITKNSVEYAGQVPSGILAVEGKRIVAIDHEAILTRKRIMYNGSVVVTAVVDRDGQLAADLKITALGLIDENSELDAKYMSEVIREVELRMKNLPKDLRRDDAALSEEIRLAARRYFQDQLDRKPQTRVHLIRI